MYFSPNRTLKSAENKKTLDQHKVYILDLILKGKIYWPVPTKMPDILQLVFVFSPGKLDLFKVLQ